MIHWADMGDQPAHIWTFLDLQDLPPGTNIPLEDGMRLNKAGIYAVVECATPNMNPQEVQKSQFLLPYRKITKSDDPLLRKFYLLDVNTFAAPVCLVPDLGGERNAYLRVQSRTKWLDLYSRWLRDNHEDIDELLTEEEINSRKKRKRS